MKVLLTVILAALAAVAQPGAAASWGDFAGQRFDLQADRKPPDGVQRPPPPDFRRVPERLPDRDKRDGRLTEEERRELRRDIDRAGREIYKRQQK